MDPDNKNLFSTPISSSGHPAATSFPSPPSFVLPLSMASTPFNPSLKFDCFESELGAGEILPDAPQPLGTLYETPIPPFLIKTYDFVDDPSLDAIVSWGAKGESFVVWDPPEFARLILPRNFKHNNFSSFVRQLNTYGFRKIDTVIWEFAKDGFRKGQRHSLKNIQRRKSHQSQPIGSLSERGSNKVQPEAEFECLRKERRLMMQKVVELQHQQLGTVRHIEIMNEKLQTAEIRQKRTVSLLGKIFNSPAFRRRLRRKTMRKFIKHQQGEKRASGSDQKGHVVKYPLLETVGRPVLGTKDVSFQVEDESEMMHGILGTSDHAESKPAHVTTGPFFQENVEDQSVPDYFTLFPDDLGKEKKFLELKISESESSMVVEEGIWSMGFETGIGLWGNVNDYNWQELGGLPNIWQDEDSPYNDYNANKNL